jgi:hypothetical protein
LEVLAALSIALLFSAVFTRGFGMAWSQARRPAETTWAIALSRKISADLRNGEKPGGDSIAPFEYDTHIEPLTVETLDSSLPPAPRPASTPAPSQEPVPRGVLKEITVTVLGPSGRKYNYETIHLDFQDSD